MKRSGSVLAVIALAAVLALASACDGDGVAEPTATAPVAGPTATTAATGEPTSRTGIAELDQVIDTLRSHDREALRQLIRFTKFACTATPPEPGSPPGCAQGEQHGDLVDIFPLSRCEGEPLRPGFIDVALDILAQSSLYAVYRAPPDHPFADEYVAVIAGSSATLWPGKAWEVAIDEGRIVGLFFSCVLTPEELIDLRQLEDVVLPPETP